MNPLSISLHLIVFYTKLFRRSNFFYFYFLQDLQLFGKIEWVGGKPPIAEPKCGFRGEKCISKFVVTKQKTYLLKC